MIAIDLLEAYGAVIKDFTKSEIIFEEGKLPTHYYQVLSGEVKMNNYNDEGREFTQGIFYKNQCFGEPPLFINQVYPANAVAVEKTQILVLVWLLLRTWHNDYIRKQLWLQRFLLMNLSIGCCDW